MISISVLVLLLVVKASHAVVWTMSGSYDFHYCPAGIHMWITIATSDVTPSVKTDFANAGFSTNVQPTLYIYNLTMSKDTSFTISVDVQTFLQIQYQTPSQVIPSEALYFSPGGPYFDLYGDLSFSDMTTNNPALFAGTGCINGKTTAKVVYETLNNGQQK